MYSPLQLGVKYLSYLITAGNGKGHGVHSPFVFEFITKVLNDKTDYEAYAEIEGLRRRLLVNGEVLVIRDFGAGSSVMKSNERKVSDIARSSLKPKKFSQLLYRIVRYYKPQTLIELGTSLGITATYLASANKQGKLYTFEGAEEVAQIAKQCLNHAGLANVELVQGNFDETLSDKLQRMPGVDFAFVDGNHRKAPTLQYFSELLKKANEHSIFIFDDIHWSVEMDDAWREIKRHPAVTLTIDLFFIGLVFFRKEQKVVQYFTVRF